MFSLEKWEHKDNICELNENNMILLSVSCYFIGVLFSYHITIEHW